MCILICTTHIIYRYGAYMVRKLQIKRLPILYIFCFFFAFCTLCVECTLPATRYQPLIHFLYCPPSCFLGSPEEVRSTCEDSVSSLRRTLNSDSKTVTECLNENSLSKPEAVRIGDAQWITSRKC